MELKSFQRSYLTKIAHDIKPSVMLGANGLTEAVIKQTEDMLEQHELIKVRFVDYKRSKKELTISLCSSTDAELVRVIGNIAILYRQARKPDNRKLKVPVKK